MYSMDEFSVGYETDDEYFSDNDTELIINTIKEPSKYDLIKQKYNKFQKHIETLQHTKSLSRKEKYALETIEKNTLYIEECFEMLKRFPKKYDEMQEDIDFYQSKVDNAYEILTLLSSCKGEEVEDDGKGGGGGGINDEGEEEYKADDVCG